MPHGKPALLFLYDAIKLLVLNIYAWTGWHLLTAFFLWDGWKNLNSFMACLLTTASLLYLAYKWRKESKKAKPE